MLYKTILPCLLALGLSACHNRPAHHPSKPNSSPTTNATVKPNAMDYDRCKQNLVALKKQYAAQWPQLNMAAKQQLFLQVVADSIFPHWMGTPWDFNGVTETPKQGSIACGYFVTTTLRDAGMPLQRAKLAQCASEQMIRSLVRPPFIQRFSNIPLPSFVAAIEQQGKGLYIIGLDSHTGFLYHDGQSIHFIHASYIGERVVIKEPALGSAILRASRYRITGKISADETALNKWMEG